MSESLRATEEVSTEPMGAAEQRAIKNLYRHAVSDIDVFLGALHVIPRCLADIGRLRIMVRELGGDPDANGAETPDETHPFADQ